MSKKWESLAIAALVSSSLNANGVEANSDKIEENGNKIELVQENVRDTLKNDSIIAWEQVLGLREGNGEENTQSSREDVAQEMFKDGQEYNKTDSMINECKNKIKQAIEQGASLNEIDSLENANFQAMESLTGNNSLKECASIAIFQCMATQTTHPKRISLRYGGDGKDYEQMLQERDDMVNVHADFLEYLATTGDKKLAEVFGVAEDKMLPEELTMALAYGPKIPYEVQEQLYNEAKKDGRLEEYKENCSSMGGQRERYPELDVMQAFPDGGARMSMGIEKMYEFADSISDRYGKNANALLIKAFTSDKELAENLGFEDEKPDAQQLVYMLAKGKPLSLEVQNELVSEKDRANADKVLDFMVNKNRKEGYFTMNYDEQKSENKVQSVVDMVKKEQSGKEIKNLENKLKEDSSNIYSKTENVEKNMAIMFAKNRER